MNASARIALANARAAEARIVAYAGDSVDLAYLRNLTRQLSAALDQLQREVSPPTPANREPLDGMLVLDLAAAPTPAVSFSGFVRSAS